MSSTSTGIFTLDLGSKTYKENFQSLAVEIGKGAKVAFQTGGEKWFAVITTREEKESDNFTVTLHEKE